MGKKNIYKLILDIGMVIVLVLMYKKSAINLTFHEVGGLILLGVFVIHILLNRIWVVSITHKLFNKSVPIKTKVGYFINILLLISFLLIGISGIFISKIVFHISYTGSINWKTIHVTAAAFALILIGIHTGLHYHFISGMFKKIIPLPNKVSKPIGIVLTIVIFAYGCYSFTSNNFYNWITMPFSAQQMNGNYGGNGLSNPGGGNWNRPEGKEDGNTTSTDNTTSSSNETSTDNTTSTDSTTSNDNSASNGFDKGSADGRGGSKPMGDGKGFQHGGEMGQSVSFSNAIKTFIDYFSITFVFAVLTVMIEKIIKRLKSRKKLIGIEAAE